MKRTQLYIDDDLWQTMTDRAKRDKTTVSELMRQAARTQYMSGSEERTAALLAIAGSLPNYGGDTSATKLVRDMRKGMRFDRLHK